MDEATRRQLFRPFFTTRHGGTGLGPGDRQARHRGPQGRHPRRVAAGQGQPLHPDPAAVTSIPWRRGRGCWPTRVRTYKWLNRPTVLSSEATCAGCFACCSRLSLWALVAPVAGVYGRRTSSSTTTRARRLHHATRRRRRSRAVHPAARALSLLGRPRLDPPANTPAHVVGEDFTLLDPDGNPVIRVPVAYADVHLQELVGLARQDGADGRAPLLPDAALLARLHPVAAGRSIAPTRSTWGRSKVEVNIVAAMSARKATPSRRAAPSSSASTTRSSATSASPWRRRALDGKPTWWAKLDGVHAKAGLKYSSDRELATADGPYFFFRLVDDQVARRGAAARRLSTSRSRALTRRRVRRARRRAPGAALRRRRPHARRRVRAERAARRRLLASTPACSSRSTSSTGAVRWRSCRAPLSTWLSGNPRARITIDGPFTHPVIDGEVHEIDANLEGIKLTDGNAKLHFDDGKLVAAPRRRQARARRGQRRHRPRAARAEPLERARRPARRRPGRDPASCPRRCRRELAGRLDGTRAPRRQPRAPSRAHRSCRACRPSSCARARAASCRASCISSPATASTRRRSSRCKDVTASGDGVTVGADGTIDPRSGRVDAGVRVDASPALALFSRWGAPAGLHVDALHATGRVVGRAGAADALACTPSPPTSPTRAARSRSSRPTCRCTATRWWSATCSAAASAPRSTGSAELGLFDGSARRACARRRPCARA